jgi:ATP-dependent helicase/nuclease subunit B
VTLIDYKTGRLPATADILAGFSPQLTLEAAMAQHCAFGPELKSATLSALYVKLGGADGGEEKRLDFPRSETGFMEVAERHYSGLIELLNQFRDTMTPYPPRPFPKYAKRYNPYDHLARAKEWSRGGAAEEQGG